MFVDNLSGEGLFDERPMTQTSPGTFCFVVKASARTRLAAGQRGMVELQFHEPESWWPRLDFGLLFAGWESHSGARLFLR
jgi:hypothetical protein